MLCACGYLAKRESQEKAVDLPLCRLAGGGRGCALSRCAIEKGRGHMQYITLPFQNTNQLDNHRVLSDEWLKPFQR